MAKRKPSKKTNPQQETGAALRVAGYCRTSGEGQRDNTSIPRQRESIEQLCEREGWKLIKHYVDESKSGSTVEGRDEFQQMMRDAANDKFDLIVVYDITRFARDGIDILTNAKFLKSTFGVCVVDTKGQFDNRSVDKTFTNHMFAAISEHERLSIMQRTQGGRIEKAKRGEPWTGTPPFGREYDKVSKTWYVTERGKNIKALLERYARGEYLADLVGEYDLNVPSNVVRAVRDGQLSGPFYATFNCPDLDIIDLKILIPQMPEVIPAALAKKVEQRLAHNRKYTKGKTNKYLLTGFIRCGVCGSALTSASTPEGNQHYRHHARSGVGGRGCGFNSIKATVAEAYVLDYLYQFFLDQPAFDAAITKAMPSDDERKAVEREASRVRQEVAKLDKRLKNLIDAIASGVDATLLIESQSEIKSERASLAGRMDQVENQLAEMPDVAATEHQAQALRLRMVFDHQDKDWRTLPFDDVRSFLRYLFGDNSKETGTGIIVEPRGDDWRITLKGRIGDDREIINGRPTIPGAGQVVDEYKRKAKKTMENASSTPVTSDTSDS